MCDGVGLFGVVCGFTVVGFGRVVGMCFGCLMRVCYFSGVDSRRLLVWCLAFWVCFDGFYLLSYFLLVAYYDLF